MTRWFASAVRALPVALSLLATTTVTFAQTRADSRLNTMLAEAGRSQAMLRFVLRQLPKGADLHNHGSGGIFAEDILALALEQAAYDNNLYLELLMGPTVSADLNALSINEAWNEADMQGRFRSPAATTDGVPVARSTDDSGVSRNDLTNEYLRAVTEHNLQYADLHQISRDSLTYSFIEGDSL